MIICNHLLLPISALLEAAPIDLAWSPLSLQILDEPSHQFGASVTSSSSLHPSLRLGLSCEEYGIYSFEECDSRSGEEEVEALLPNSSASYEGWYGGA